ncbi:hypothetical protein KK120_08805 [Virgibacillus dakarensis]|nr:hypothetical protein [Virgibacillus dakarensis]MBT2215921.1 hypothetical protein [Virgibacillus dakarensis]
MQIFTCYKDLVRMIDLLQSQLELLEGELSYWWPIGKGQAKGFHDYSLDITSKKYDSIQDQMKQTRKILTFYETIKEEMDEHIHSLEGLEYKVAYKRFIEDKTYKEIADELGYNYNYIRQVAAESSKKTKKLTNI